MPPILMGLTFFSPKQGFINCLFGQNLPYMLFREKNQYARKTSQLKGSVSTFFSKLNVLLHRLFLICQLQIQRIPVTKHDYRDALKL